MTQHERNAKVFKALCDEKRLRILQLLQSGEKCVCLLYDQLGLPQSTLSYHLKILCESGLVAGRQDGKWTHYRIDVKGSKRAETLLRALTAVHADESRSAACGTAPADGRQA